MNYTLCHPVSPDLKSNSHPPTLVVVHSNLKQDGNKGTGLLCIYAMQTLSDGGIVGDLLTDRIVASGLVTGLPGSFLLQFVKKNSGMEN